MANMLMQASPQESDMASEDTGVEISSGSKLGDSAKLGFFGWEQKPGLLFPKIHRHIVVANLNTPWTSSLP